MVDAFQDTLSAHEFSLPYRLRKNGNRLDYNTQVLYLENGVKHSANVTLATLHLILLGKIEADGLRLLEHRMQLTSVRKL